MKKFFVKVTALESPEFGFCKEFGTRIEVDGFMGQFDKFEQVHFMHEDTQGHVLETVLLFVANFHMTIEIVDRGIF